MRRWFVSSQAFFLLSGIFLLNGLLDLSLGEHVMAILALILSPVLFARAIERRRKGF